jgi:hypothetical protein
MEYLGLHNKPKTELHSGQNADGPRRRRIRRRRRRRKFVLIEESPIADYTLCGFNKLNFLYYCDVTNLHRIRPVF